MKGLLITRTLLLLSLLILMTRPALSVHSGYYVERDVRALAPDGRLYDCSFKGPILVGKNYVSSFSVLLRCPTFTTGRTFRSFWAREDGTLLNTDGDVVGFKSDRMVSVEDPRNGDDPYIRTLADTPEGIVFHWTVNALIGPVVVKGYLKLDEGGANMPLSSIESGYYVAEKLTVTAHGQQHENCSFRGAILVGTNYFGMQDVFYHCDGFGSSVGEDKLRILADSTIERRGKNVGYIKENKIFVSYKDEDEFIDTTLSLEKTAQGVEIYWDLGNRVLEGNLKLKPIELKHGPDSKSEHL